MEISKQDWALYRRKMPVNVNGNLVWKTKEGTCLGEYRKKY